MELHAWANGVVSALGQYSNVMNPLIGDDWQSWGMMFMNDPNLTALNPPNPYDYSDWVPWGERLADALGNASGAPTPVQYQKGIVAHTLLFIAAHTTNILVAH